MTGRVYLVGSGPGDPAVLDRGDEGTGHLVAGGRDPGTPVAIVERAIRPGQRIVTDTLEEIAETAREFVDT